MSFDTRKSSTMHFIHYSKLASAKMNQTRLATLLKLKVGQQWCISEFNENIDKKMQKGIGLSGQSPVYSLQALFKYILFIILIIYIDIKFPPLFAWIIIYWSLHRGLFQFECGSYSKRVATSVVFILYMYLSHDAWKWH